VTAPPLASSFGSFFNAVDDFFSSLAALDPLSLIAGLSCFCIYISTRSYAYYNVLRAAYPQENFPFWKIWGAYWAAYGFNNVVPARGGDVMKLFLVRSTVPNSSYPAIGSSFFVEAVFDAVMAVFVLTFAFSQGVFPKPPDFSKLQAFDLSYFASHLRFTLFVVTAAVVALLGLFALLSVRVKAFWQRVKQGVVILRDRPRFIREVFAVQFVAWLFRFAAFWFLLDAFGVGGSVTNTLLVLGVNAIAAIVPFTPGGAGVQQALIVQVFSATATSATVAAYSVGQQIAIGAFSLAVGFGAIIFVFRFRSFREVIAAGKQSRAQDAEREAAEREEHAAQARAAARGGF